MSRGEHWENIHRRGRPEGVSWYRPHLERSLRFIEEAGLALDAAGLDVGGGTSTLVDDLLDRGFSKVSVLDISRSAIRQAQARLGTRAEAVTWLIGDIARMKLPKHHYDFWHDRAVFHFLTEDADRRRYVTAVRRSLKPNGHIVVATFGLAGPERCSGLPVVRYSPQGIQAELGDQFRKVGSAREIHHTPSGREQEFVYCYCRMPA